MAEGVRGRATLKGSRPSGRSLRTGDRSGLVRSAAAPCALPAELLDQSALRVVGLADVEGALPISLPVVEVPVRPARRAGLGVGAVLQLQDAAAAVSALSALPLALIQRTSWKYGILGSSRIRLVLRGLFVSLHAPQCAEKTSKRGQIANNYSYRDQQGGMRGSFLLGHAHHALPYTLWIGQLVAQIEL